MYCKKCGAIWSVGNLSPSINNCPICNDNYFNNPDDRGFHTIIELIQFLILINGVSYWNNSKGIQSYLNDYFPLMVEERGDIKKLLDNGFGIKMQQWYRNVPQRETVYQQISSVGIQKYRDEFVSGILYLVGKDRVSGTNFEESNYYLEYAKKTNIDTYKIMALEKAIFYGADEKIVLQLAEIQLINDTKKGIELLKSLAQKNNLVALLKMAKICEDGIYIKQNYKEEIQYLEQAVKQNDGEAMYQLGRLYILGKGVKRSRKKAVELFKQSAQENNPKANYQLYSIRYNSCGNVNQEAMGWLEVSAKSGYVPAMYEYALHLLYGESINENIELAISVLEECANSGNEEAIEKLSYMYSVGFKVQKDKEKALQWKEKLMEK